ncbi:tetraacyldisaccharide 4'-kinase [Caviibacterium pharyngocola]|uniref:Tetraacyldisaccharide 4'-kinase n=1 Tax=Caviibacterium pharyngocola TaxID=28159 RepID=A0A2M8RW72_9PAST|nr:tetraacyldisaccharide 4'-kinase [Caviibacterium pharyngocola]PJG83129.1 tetraacyldisaccharide 4'-kinase [Caviibacterium pharyngocola]
MKFWYSSDGFSTLLKWLLSPFSLLFYLIAALRRQLLQKGVISSYRAPVPVVIVGNLSVGGNGKTPVVVWLVRQLQQQGLNVGVISRGYGSRSEVYPRLVSAQDDPIQSGDEPLLIAKRTGAPVCISPNRREAVECLLSHHPCDVIISDDGLQHYKLQRDVEIVVMDAERGLGNGFVLPAGPLREGKSRLACVDLIIANGREHPYASAVMRLIPQYAINLLSGEKRLLSEFRGQAVTAVAGIGNPQRFFTMLRDLNIDPQETHAFSDHQHFDAASFAKFTQNRPLFMTEKDAVKCGEFAQRNWWYVPVDAEISGQSAEELIRKIVKGVKGER